MPSEGFIGCTLGCLAGGAFEPNAAILCLLSCYLVEIHGEDDSDEVDAIDRNGDDRNDEGGPAGQTGSPKGPAS